ncbi:hypothetical protein GEV33_011526 [Tenebrio molitor]|uniref:Uncharacterized protein n=1 Tax=Tenebrio molitor TaxID=7067 RepID=A0A8J6HAU5_TENMO|nr:hypothetical protein GEV33_011526 [Tenebrio molitor]
MAYVIWRVVMKRYSRIRLGLHGGAAISSHSSATEENSSEAWIFPGSSLSSRSSSFLVHFHVNIRLFAHCRISIFAAVDNLPVDRRGGAPPSSTDFPTDDRSIFEIGKSPMLTCGTDTNVGTGPSALENVKMRFKPVVPIAYHYGTTTADWFRANPFKPTRVMKMIFTRPHAKEKVLARTVGGADSQDVTPPTLAHNVAAPAVVESAAALFRWRFHCSKLPAWCRTPRRMACSRCIEDASGRKSGTNFAGKLENAIEAMTSFSVNLQTILFTFERNRGLHTRRFPNSTQLGALHSQLEIISRRRWSALGVDFEVSGGPGPSRRTVWGSLLRPNLASTINAFVVTFYVRLRCLSSSRRVLSPGRIERQEIEFSEKVLSRRQISARDSGRRANESEVEKEVFLVVALTDSNRINVTPTGRHVLTYDEESWKPTPEEPKPEDISRANEARQSKAKRVKKYLKKCKNVLGRSTSSDVPAEEAPSTSSWYLEELINVSEINELEDVYEDAVQVGTVDSGAVYQVASVVDDVKKNESVGLADSSPPLTEEQGKVDGADGDEEGEKPQALMLSYVGQRPILEWTWLRFGIFLLNFLVGEAARTCRFVSLFLSGSVTEVATSERGQREILEIYDSSEEQESCLLSCIMAAVQEEASVVQWRWNNIYMYALIPVASNEPSAVCLLKTFSEFVFEVVVVRSHETGLYEINYGVRRRLSARLSSSRLIVHTPPGFDLSRYAIVGVKVHNARARTTPVWLPGSPRPTSDPAYRVTRANHAADETRTQIDFSLGFYRNVTGSASGRSIFARSRIFPCVAVFERCINHLPELKIAAGGEVDSSARSFLSRGEDFFRWMGRTRK